MSILIGAIADDFTGATDLANTLVNEGLRVTQVIGVPDGSTQTGDVDAVVIALKSRTAPVKQAVGESLAALAWLREQGASQILFKYCSTFDSTAQGNIGPVADALSNALDSQLAFICPAFPENGRSIYQGHLFVGDKLLSESSMKDHPLTPMRDANLVRLMSVQSTLETGLVPLSVVRVGAKAITEKVAELSAAGMRYAVVDAVSDDDLRCIGEAAAGHVLVTGGSGVALGLPDNLRRAGKAGSASAPEYPVVAGRQLILAGSCSAATRAQIAKVQDRWPTLKVDVEQLASGNNQIDTIASWALSQDPDLPVLVYASSDPDEVRAIQQRHGVEEAGKLVENTLSALASNLHVNGFSRLVVAGGETSGAVVSALGVKALRIGPAIAPGVPWTEALGQKPLALALKSGNFGGEYFFEDAFSSLP